MNKQDAENGLERSNNGEAKSPQKGGHIASRLGHLFIFAFLGACVWHCLIGSLFTTPGSHSMITMITSSLTQAIKMGLAAIAVTSPTVAASASACDFDMYEHMGNLSPYFQPSNTPPSLSSGAPPECAVTKAFLVHRHGSRNPLSDEIGTIQGLAYYLGNESSLFSAPRAPIPDALAFLQEGWNSTFTTNDLSPVGRQQLFDHGVALRLQYPQLTASRVLAGDQDRVVESARWFMDGYFGRSANSSAPLDRIAEDNGTVSWITPMDTCEKWTYGFGGAPVSEWGRTYLPPIAHRLNRLLADSFPGVNFTAAHVHGMLYACVYGTAVYGKDSSPWCPVFTRDEILAHEYEYDLLMRGAFGYGLPGDMGPVLGSLLVSNVTEFLLKQDGKGEENLALHFGHDTTIDLGLASLHLAQDSQFPATGPVDPDRAWRTARQVPFAAQMLFRGLDCEGGEKRIQLLLNEANFDLSPSGCESDDYGTCKMSDFTASETVKAALAVTHVDARWQAVCSA
ncbi:Phosphoglycerate mutase-like protein [Apiospora phragmitis]|uniref:3-phytase n=1 Tax=Apiospora phragmitis TaxID=2905665 RepID=A0ABR1T7C9_9PEZI